MIEIKKGDRVYCKDDAHEGYGTVERADLDGDFYVDMDDEEGLIFFIGDEVTLAHPGSPEKLEEVELLKQYSDYITSVKTRAGDSLKDGPFVGDVLQGPFNDKHVVIHVEAVSGKMWCKDLRESGEIDGGGAGYFRDKNDVSKIGTIHDMDPKEQIRKQIAEKEAEIAELKRELE